MDINAGIIDQRLVGIIEKHSELLPNVNDEKKKSAAFVLLCISVFMDFGLEEAAELLTDGSNDAGVDGLHYGDVSDGEFTVTIFQGKYKAKLNGNYEFQENTIIKAVNTVSTLFDPNKRLVALNDAIKPKVEEIRSLIRDGYIPTVRVVLCNNGLRWNEEGQKRIENSGFGEQVSWVHFSHNDIVAVLQSTKSVNDSIRFNGKAVIEDFNFRRVLIGKVPVTEIADLFNRHGNLLLERNIRRYLGMHKNRVNSAIHATLEDADKRDNFYFFNNGITMVCSKFRYNALQGENYQVKIDGMQIINGGQTCKTIQQALDNPEILNNSASVYVLLRLYELSEEDSGLVRDITYATNSQNPVDLRDLRSNDEIQKKLEIGISELGYTYKRHREEGRGGSSVITSSVVAEAVLAVFKCKPHQAKFMRKEHFGKLYEEIFLKLHPAQAVLAALIFRYVESVRKRTTVDNVLVFLPYASHYISMIIGLLLVHAQKLDDFSDVTHNNFDKVYKAFEENKQKYYMEATLSVASGLKKLYSDSAVSLQQLSATFRRGDLLGIIVDSFDKPKKLTTTT